MIWLFWDVCMCMYVYASVPYLSIHSEWMSATFRFRMWIHIEFWMRRIRMDRTSTLKIVDDVRHLNSKGWWCTSWHFRWWFGRKFSGNCLSLPKCMDARKLTVLVNCHPNEVSTFERIRKIRKSCDARRHKHCLLCLLCSKFCLWFAFMVFLVFKVDVLHRKGLNAVVGRKAYMFATCEWN